MAMNTEPVVLEISSDEESSGDDDFDDATDDWLSPLLDGNDVESEDSDDVVVLDGNSCVSKAPNQDCVASNAVNCLSGDNDSDDDCLILDGDPDKPVSVVDEAENGSDDLLVVAEKGQLACRDYPHPRHLCAKFPFNSTPHEKHCDLCHCYVCDSLAPCLSWGTGVAIADHCNSTDKEEVWRIQRKNKKQSSTAPLSIQRLPDTTLSMRLPHPSTQSTFSRTSSLGQIPWQTSVSSPIEVVACSTGYASVAGHRPNSRLRILHSRNRCPQYPYRQQPLAHRSYTITKDTYGANGLGPPPLGVRQAEYTNAVSPLSLSSASSPQLRRAESGRPLMGSFRSAECTSSLGPRHRRAESQQPLFLGLSANENPRRDGSLRNSYTELNRSGHDSYCSRQTHAMPAPTGDGIELDNLDELLSDFGLDVNAFEDTYVPNSSCCPLDFPAPPNPSQPQVYNPSYPQLESNQNMHQYGNPSLNAMNLDTIELDFLWSLDGSTQGLQVNSSLPSSRQLESPTYPQPEAQHLQNTPRSVDLHQQINWVPNNLEDKTLSQDHSAFDPLLSDLDFIPLQSPVTDSGMSFYELESPWVI